MGNEDYKGATNVLITEGPTLEDLAAVCGVSYGTVRQARLDPDSRSHRPPPREWRVAVARLARQRADELRDLADRLERDEAELRELLDEG